MAVKYRGFALLLAAALLSACEPAAIEPSSAAPAPVARGPLTEREADTVALFERAAPSVVQVVSRSTVVTPFNTGEQVGSGTGFIWDDEGYIVTNNHVVEAQEIAVRLSDGDVRATVIGRAPQYDIAVLRMARKPDAPPLALGTSADLKVGQSVFAIGNPFGLDQTLTSGIVSALARRLPLENGREITGVIQTDAAINPGNSGGPLLDSAGRVIGVNTAIYSPSGANAGVGFAVPIDTVRRVVPDLIRNGRAPTPGIGIIAASETDAARLGVEGVIIFRVASGTPAARAGLRGVDLDSNELGDVITAINGKKVERLVDVTNELDRAGIGKTVELTVQRRGETRQVSLATEDIGPR